LPIKVKIMSKEVGGGAKGKSDGKAHARTKGGSYTTGSSRLLNSSSQKCSSAKGKHVHMKYRKRPWGTAFGKKKGDFEREAVLERDGTTSQ